MSQCVRSATYVDATCIAPPPWVGSPSSGHWPAPPLEAGPDAISASHEGDFIFLGARLPDADRLDADVLSASVRSLYLRVHEVLQSRTPAEPVRFWNYIPGIHDAMGDGLSRYMVFNAGRFAAMEEVHRGPGEFERRVATATGVGHAGHDLLIYCLASSLPGAPVENPRQIPAYRYSQRHGPVPPCFARATVVPFGDARLGLIGGTAAVRGEDSMHAGDLHAQLTETFENIDRLVAAARGASGPPRPARFRGARAYVVRPADMPGVRARVAERFTGTTVEVVRADVCRPELLVEIEAVVEL